MTPSSAVPRLRVKQPGLVGAVALVFFVLLLWRVAEVVLLVFGGVVLATALLAFASPLVRRLRWSPRLALAVVLVIAAAAIAGFGWLMGDLLTGQFENLRQRLPDAVAAVTEWLRTHPGGQPVLDAWESAKRGELPWSNVLNIASMTVGALGAAAVVVFVGIFLAADPALYRRGLVRLAHPRHRSALDDSLHASGKALALWLRGQAISMLFVGAAFAIGLTALGMPAALSLGVIAGALAFIPYFGALVSTLLAILFAFLQGPRQALWVAIVCFSIQQVEGHVVSPLVQRWAVQLPPVIAIVAAVAFGLLFGPLGVLFATPLAVVVMTLVRTLYVERHLESPASDLDVSRGSRAGS